MSGTIHVEMKQMLRGVGMEKNRTLTDRMMAILYSGSVNVEITFLYRNHEEQTQVSWGGMSD